MTASVSCRENGKYAMQLLMSDRISTACPAILLKLHPNVAVLCDEAAYSDTLSNQ